MMIIMMMMKMMMMMIMMMMMTKASLIQGVGDGIVGPVGPTMEDIMMEMGE